MGNPRSGALNKVRLQFFSSIFHKFTLFQALYGKTPPYLGTVSHESTTPIGSLETLLQERDAMLDELKFHLYEPNR